MSYEEKEKNWKITIKAISITVVIIIACCICKNVWPGEISEMIIPPDNYVLSYPKEMNNTSTNYTLKIPIGLIGINIYYNFINNINNMNYTKTMITTFRLWIKENYLNSTDQFYEQIPSIVLRGVGTNYASIINDSGETFSSNFIIPPIESNYLNNRSMSLFGYINSNIEPLSSVHIYVKDMDWYNFISNESKFFRIIDLNKSLIKNKIEEYEKEKLDYEKNVTKGYTILAIYFSGLVIWSFGLSLIDNCIEKYFYNSKDNNIQNVRIHFKRVNGETVKIKCIYDHNKRLIERIVLN